MSEQLSLIPVEGLERRSTDSPVSPPKLPRAPKDPTFRLVRRPPAPTTPPALDAAQRRVAAHTAGPLLVLAGPGTGKTTTLVESVVARIEAGVDPERILVLTFGRKAANQLRERITARLGRTTTEPLARTFHSYAFGLLRRAATDAGDPPPRLLTGPEQDLMVHDLLKGHADGEGTVRWPKELEPALRTRGFAAELRDLLLRAVERGVEPKHLRAWAKDQNRPEWLPAAQAYAEYLDVMALSTASVPIGETYDPAELIGSAVSLLAGDAELLAAERAARAYVFVDEYQDIDPAQEELLALLAGNGRFLVAVGDPDQSIYAFRGSDADVMSRFADTFAPPDRTDVPTVALTVCRRMRPALIAASRNVTKRLPWTGRHRDLAPVPGTDDGDVEVAVLRTGHAEAGYIAQRFRREHLLNKVPWSRMAVIVRSTAIHQATVRRALLHAGIPTAAGDGSLPLAGQPGVSPLLSAVQCALGLKELDEDVAVSLLQSPLGDADALALRRLRQQLRLVASAAGDQRPSGVLLAEALHNPVELLPLEDRWASPARQVGAVLTAARQAADEEGATAETVLWAAWTASGLHDRWYATSLSGGPGAAAADRDLDAVVALFEAAGEFSDGHPGAGPEIFLRWVAGQDIAADTIAPAAAAGEVVRVLTAHAAKGLEWDVVAVAGVQEGLWPDLRPRGSLLGSEELVDLAANREPNREGQLSALLDEERRLFYVAVTRARTSVLVTAVDGDDGDQPSRFLDEFEPRPGASDPREPAAAPRTLSLGGLVAELRAVVLDAGADPVRRRAAAAQLARLADERVTGAAPSSWWGRSALSDAGPLREGDEMVSISPSRVEVYKTCSLRWLLESAGGATTGAAQQIGTVVHDVAADIAEVPPDEVNLALLNARLAERWKLVDLSGWYEKKQRQRAEKMVAKLADWLAANPRQLVAAEREFTVDVGRARLRGRVDRLERDAAGRLVVVDLKTGVGKPKDDELPEHAQLGVYQLAVEKGGFPEASSSGGAALVQLGNKTVKHSVQQQQPLAEQENPDWADELVRTVAEGMSGSVFEATTNDYCRMCPVSSSCPVQAGQVTT